MQKRIETKKQKTKRTLRQKTETFELYLFKRKTNYDIGANPSINVRLNCFSFKKKLI